MYSIFSKKYYEIIERKTKFHLRRMLPKIRFLGVNLGTGLRVVIDCNLHSYEDEKMFLFLFCKESCLNIDVHTVQYTTKLNDFIKPQFFI